MTPSEEELNLFVDQHIYKYLNFTIEDIIKNDNLVASKYTWINESNYSIHIPISFFTNRINQMFNQLLLNIETQNNIGAKLVKLAIFNYYHLNDIIIDYNNLFYFDKNIFSLLDIEVLYEIIYNFNKEIKKYIYYVCFEIYTN